MICGNRSAITCAHHRRSGEPVIDETSNDILQLRDDSAIFLRDPIFVLNGSFISYASFN